MRFSLTFLSDAGKPSTVLSLLLLFMKSRPSSVEKNMRCGALLFLSSVQNSFFQGKRFLESQLLAALEHCTGWFGS